MEDTNLDYVSIRLLMQEVFCKLRKAGYQEEANAVACLTQVMGRKISYIPPLIAGGEVEDLIGYLEDCNFLNNYITDGKFKSGSAQGENANS